MKRILPIAAIALSIAACSPEQQDSAPDASASARPEPSGSATPATQAIPTTLTLEGLGALRIGQPVPADGTWAEEGAQASETCRLISSPDYPGVYGIVEDGAVRRISVHQGGNVTLVEGIGVGATEGEINASLLGFRKSPHVYVEGGSYLTAPNADSGDPALRFELDAQGEVTEMHVGTAPVLRYVEACS